MILAIDPSSSAIGFAGMTSARHLDHVGVITPDKSKAPVLDRLPGMLDELLAVVVELAPKVIVIEMPQKHAKKHGGHSGASLAFYGWACGAVWQMCRTLTYRMDLRVVAVGSGTWSKTSKEMRALGVRSEFKQLAKLKDSGMDASDAVALAQWWHERNRIIKEAV